MPEPKHVQSITDEVYEQCMVEARIDKLHQRLFWYDDLPSDEDIVSYIKELRELRHRLSTLTGIPVLKIPY